MYTKYLAIITVIEFHWINNPTIIRPLYDSSYKDWLLWLQPLFKTAGQLPCSFAWGLESMKQLLQDSQTAEMSSEKSDNSDKWTRKKNNSHHHIVIAREEKQTEQRK